MRPGMGLSGLWETAPAATVHHTHRGVLPSPAAATLRDEVDAPTTTTNFDNSTSPSSTCSSLQYPPDLLSNAIPSPAHVESCAVSTPIDDVPSHTDMNLIVGGALAPMSSVKSHPPCPSFRSLRSGADLQLPSFETLGIASPRPDRHHIPENGPAAHEPDLSPDLSTHLHATHISLSNSQPRERPGADSSRAKGTLFRHDVAALTPPAESGDVIWNPDATVSHPAMGSPTIDPGQARLTTPERDLRGEYTISPPIPAQISSSGDQQWVDGALQALLESLRTASVPVNPLRILSHALPSPSMTGHIFPALIDAIHGSTPAQPTVWINVFHAIQGRFNLADLPSSPPSTPGPAIGGDDYFTQKVFDTAVPISDYQQDLSSLPRSPRPVVPPSSINVSIVERYIPPSTTHEFADMFNARGPSILVDRLVELSPNHGTLIFIYPTRAGAETFAKEYLGPLLDPQLRSLVVLNGLSSQLGRSLGRMAAVDSLPSYEHMRSSVASFCDNLTQRSSTIERFNRTRATFSLIHASCETVHVSREAWARDWWAKQEKARIRDMITRYAHEAQRTSSNEYGDQPHTATELIQQLLDGVTRRSSYPPGQAPASGIEVSVFVIQRSG